MYKYILLSILSLAILYVIYGEDIQNRSFSSVFKPDNTAHVEQELLQKIEKKKPTKESILYQKRRELAKIEANQKMIIEELKILRNKKENLTAILLERQRLQTQRNKEAKRAKRIAEAKRIKRIKEAKTKARARAKAKRIAKAKAREKRRNHIVAHVDISSQKMKVYRGKKLLHQWLVSTARKGYSTPTGKYSPLSMQKMHYSKRYHNSPMPYSIFFRGGYAIHGTHSLNQLGRKASHGCVRLDPKNAKKLYSMIQKSGKDNAEIKITY